MRVLMLGWEYPPHICGGLGIACEGLSLALSRCGVAIDFVLPRASGDEQAPHMRLFDAVSGLVDRNSPFSERKLSPLVEKELLPALLSPYLSPKSLDDLLLYYRKHSASVPLEEIPEHLRHYFAAGENGAGRQHYGANIFNEVQRYAAHVLMLMGNAEFDVIHAHDWMTFPAAVALSRLSGKPLVVHLHSLEYDRSGQHMNHQIHEVEAMGLEQASRIITVSYYTASILKQQHSVADHKIRVVHNGVYPRKIISSYRRRRSLEDKVVLFLGRVTFQKGPDYFVEAASKVIPHIPRVKFIMAGAGDMLNRMIDRVHQLGISQHFQFPGFLRGEEVEEVFSVADLYIMPSVSEPFGISALEAINHDVPVVISKQSGVSEVLGHALKVDFWDVDRMADMMINALLHEELRSDMTSMAKEELKRLRWDASAIKVMDVYKGLM